MHLYLFSLIHSQIQIRLTQINTLQFISNKAVENEMILSLAGPRFPGNTIK